LDYKGSLSNLKNHHFSNIKLKEADEKDLEIIALLSQQIFNDSYEDSKSMIKKSLEADNRTQYIAVLDGEFIGIGAVNFENDGASIFGFGIAPEYQGKGAGKELLYLILKDLEKKNVQNLSIEVHSSNKKAFQLYKKFGFEIVASYDYFRKQAI
jgi:ribosomal protein S18 acetylase RimI-like enzyme